MDQRLIYVFLIALFLAQAGQVGLALLARHVAFNLQDVEQGLAYIAGHALHIATDIKVCTFTEPLRHVLALALHAMLHITLLFLVARKGYIQAGQQATLAVFQPFGLVQEIGGKVLVAKKEPVFTLAARGRAVLQKAPEGRYAGTCADHNDGGVVVGRQLKLVVGFNLYFQSPILGQPVGQKSGTYTPSFALVLLIAHSPYGQVNFVADFGGTRGDGVGAWRQVAEDRQQLFGIQRQGMLLQKIEHIAAVHKGPQLFGIFEQLVKSRLRLQGGVFADHRGGEHRQFVMMPQGLFEGVSLPAHLHLLCPVESALRQNSGNQLRVVVGKDLQGVAGLVDQSRFIGGQLEVPGFFFGAASVELNAFQHLYLYRLVG